MLILYLRFDYLNQWLLLHIFSNRYQIIYHIDIYLKLMESIKIDFWSKRVRDLIEVDQKGDEFK